MAVKMKALKSDSLAAILSQVKREAQCNRGLVRQHDWVCLYSGGYAAISTRPVGIV
jgi:hypothetical protein